MESSDADTRRWLWRRLAELGAALLVIGFLASYSLSVTWFWEEEAAPDTTRRALPAPADTPAPLTPAPPEPLDPSGTALLLIPVVGVSPEDLQNTFDDPRGPDRSHEAIDILAARGTPVVAATGGTIARLHESVNGGRSIYQFNYDSSRVYYYAHLNRYAAGLAAGDTVARGQRLGRVGTSGNAPDDTPHLHFAVWEVDDPANFWSGSALNPYPLLAPDSLN